MLAECYRLTIAFAADPLAALLLLGVLLGTAILLAVFYHHVVQAAIALNSRPARNQDPEPADGHTDIEALWRMPVARRRSPGTARRIHRRIRHRITTRRRFRTRPRTRI